MISGKTIFISALDWGMGHATRCVPVIRELEKNNRIIIGVTPLTKTIFEEEFPRLEKINVPPYNIKYSSFLPLWLKLLIDWPRISSTIKEEKKIIEELIEQRNIDLVISDNRFGLYSKKARSVFMTHQLFLKSPFANFIVQNKNKKYILNFDEVWVPDFEQEEKSLSGQLSHRKHFHKNVKYIGPQSRLPKTAIIENKYDYLFLLSGPQPQQSIFAHLLFEKAKNYPALKFALVSSDNLKSISENITVYNSPSASHLSEIISGSKKIICRSGYSTLMDLHHLKKKEIILVPTPGQSEQEYLAKYWSEKRGAKILNQKDLASFDL